MSGSLGTTSASTAGRARIGERLLIAAVLIVVVLFATSGRASAESQNTFTKPQPTPEAMRLPRC